ncbi:hypothetical protein IFU39_13735 [Paenibacillus sp. CFBP 13594]|uniref:hypothetical protein n=1 Tax=Paenibacillus sp. CFBP 13594 TaxID=2774037 RepID=UPI00177D4CE4|nr:hypothetical protein [Paenibacillus sp. CFBP 13594]MBD8838877.1 hypothetical protein [Paenibacillus sp. CFBP 13594]
MFYVIGHESLTNSGDLQRQIMQHLQNEQITRAQNAIPYTKEREILHYATNTYKDPRNPEYDYFSYINSNTRDLLLYYNIDFEELDTIVTLPKGVSLLIRNTRFL